MPQGFWFVAFNLYYKPFFEVLNRSDTANGTGITRRNHFAVLWKMLCRTIRQPQQKRVSRYISRITLLCHT